MPRYASADPTWTITPRSRGQHAFQRSKSAIDVAKVSHFGDALNSAGVISRAGENTETIALLIQISIGPNASSIAAAAASTCSASATSAAIDQRFAAKSLDFVARPLRARRGRGRSSRWKPRVLRRLARLLARRQRMHP